MACYYGIQNLSKVQILDWCPNEPGYLLKYNGENHVFTDKALKVLLESELFNKWFKKEHSMPAEEADNLEEIKETEWEKFVYDYMTDIDALLKETAKTCVEENKKDPDASWSVSGTPLYVAYGEVRDIDDTCYIYSDTNF